MLTHCAREEDMRMGSGPTPEADPEAQQVVDTQPVQLVRWRSPTEAEAGQGQRTGREEGGWTGSCGRVARPWPRRKAQEQSGGSRIVAQCTHNGPRTGRLGGGRTSRRFRPAKGQISESQLVSPMRRGCDAKFMFTSYAQTRRQGISVCN